MAPAKVWSDCCFRVNSTLTYIGAPSLFGPFPVLPERGLLHPFVWDSETNQTFFSFFPLFLLVVFPSLLLRRICWKVVL